MSETQKKSQPDEVKNSLQMPQEPQLSEKHNQDQLPKPSFMNFLSKNSYPILIGAGALALSILFPPASVLLFGAYAGYLSIKAINNAMHKQQNDRRMSPTVTGLGLAAGAVSTIALGPIVPIAAISLYFGGSAIKNVIKHYYANIVAKKQDQNMQNTVHKEIQKIQQHNLEKNNNSQVESKNDQSKNKDIPNNLPKESQKMQQQDLTKNNNSQVESKNDQSKNKDIQNNLPKESQKMQQQDLTKNNNSQVESKNDQSKNKDIPNNLPKESQKMQQQDLTKNNNSQVESKNYQSKNKDIQNNLPKESQKMQQQDLTKNNNSQVESKNYQSKNKYKYTPPKILKKTDHKKKSHSPMIM